MIHGGDIYRNNIRYDFSVNTNPLGMPKSIKSAIVDGVSLMENYPDIRSEALTNSLAKYIGVCAEDIVLGNGASELFMAIVHALCPKKALLVLPSFFGYQWALNALGVQTVKYYSDENDDFSIKKDFVDMISSDIDVIFLANPNNPNGAYIDNKILIDIIKKSNVCGVKVVLDECFIELSDEGCNRSLSKDIETFDNLIIVNAFTKTYAIAGLRLGYLICHDNNVISDIRKHLPEWNISIAAQLAGMAALSEQEYVKTSKSLIKAQKPYLLECLSKFSKVFNSDANFILFKTERKLYDTLIKKGILIRDCSNFDGLGQGFYRIAVKDELSNKVLIDSLK